MIKYGLKIWSNNTYLFDEIIERYNHGEFDFIELYSNSEFDHDYSSLLKLKAVPVLGVHIGNLDKAGFHDFYLTEDQKKPWQMTVDLADFFNVSRIVVHPAVEHTLETFLENLKKLNDDRIIIETMPAKSPLRDTLRLFGTSLEDFREIRKNRQMCLDIQKTIKAGVYHKIDYKEYILQALDIIKPEYFHISGCNIDDPFDQHGNVYEAGFDVAWVRNILENYSKNKEIYLVFETPKIADNLVNDIKNIEYFKRSNLRISLRPATINDAEKLLELRNDPVVRYNSFSKNIIDLDEHNFWLEKVLSGSNKFLFIILNEYNMEIGQVRFDMKEDIVEINISIDSSHRGKGYGTKSIKYSSEKFLKENKKIKRIIARIKPENKLSVDVFTNAGYKEYRQDDSIIYMKFEL